MKLPAQPNQSLIDGMSCLEVLSAAGEAIGTRELARRLEMEPTRVNRLLKTLGGIGLAMQDDKRRYKIGPGIHALSALSLRASGLTKVALPHLLKLRETGYRIALGNLWRREVVYLYHGAADAPEIEGIGNAQLWPAERSSIGLSLLAQKTREEVLKIFRGSNIDEIELLNRLKQTQINGYGSMRFEKPKGEVSIGVAVNDDFGIGLTGTIKSKEMSVLIKKLHDIAKVIRENLSN